MVDVERSDSGCNDHPNPFDEGVRYGQLGEEVVFCNICPNISDITRHSVNLICAKLTKLSNRPENYIANYALFHICKP